MVVTNFLCQQALSETGRAAGICHSSYFEIRLIKIERKKKRKPHFINFYIKKKKRAENLEGANSREGKGRASSRVQSSKAQAASLQPCQEQSSPAASPTSAFY